MAGSTVRGIRLPDWLIERLDQEARMAGMAFGPYIAELLKKHVTGGADALPVPDGTEHFICQVSEHVRQTYTADRFPPDVTLLTFRRIAETPEWRSAYHQLITSDGDRDASAQASLNMKIGLAIKRALGARSGPRASAPRELQPFVSTFTTLLPSRKVES